jgi:hypothetical protein
MLQEIIERVSLLSEDERLRLMVYLSDRVRQEQPEEGNWLDLCGLATYPLLGEDAQAWVSRTRREDSEHREAVLRR